ncbi:MAG: ATP-binding protein [Sporomusaceae bacterium]|nr:ATP-binding protein [Sporomusaceae bacterium]
MWSRIKPASISSKLTLLYTAMLSCILLFTSLLTVAALYYVLYTQAKTDFAISVSRLDAYVAAGNPVDQMLLANNLLVPGMILKVLDDNGDTILDSAPYLPDNPETLEEAVADHDPLEIVLLRQNTLRIINMEQMYYYYVTHPVRQNGQTYQLQLLKALTEQAHFLQTLTKILTATNLIGLLTAILSGMFISRRILLPLRSITATAREIRVDDLSKRIRVGSSGDELAELAETFNHMLGRLQTGFEQQRRFVADASHELRTPITVISGYVNMLDRWGKEEPQALAEGLEAVKSEADNMNNLIEKLLYLARADQGKQQLHKADLATAPFIETVFQETRLIAPDHRVSLTLNDPAVVEADGAALKQMLRIFIENSIKYTPPGGSIRLAARHTGHQLEITIADSGIGIPATDQSKIFDRFYRVDQSRSKSTGGTGLGLSIARWIADQHECGIKLNSSVGQGTVVTLELAAKPQQQLN